MTERTTRAPRYRVKGLNVVYDANEEYWTGPVLDASVSGLFIETTHDVPVGTELTLMPEGADDHRLPFEVRGVVVRVQELDWDNQPDRTPGLAVRFEGLSQDEAESFQAFLREHGTAVE